MKGIRTKTMLFGKHCKDVYRTGQAGSKEAAAVNLFYRISSWTELTSDDGKRTHAQKPTGKMFTRQVLQLGAYHPML